jgi:hypothetical protein
LSYEEEKKKKKKKKSKKAKNFSVRTYSAQRSRQHPAYRLVTPLGLA